ncbi:MAG TPA: hypothetical protein VEA92_02035 [Candidatus Paceibacterota bacterium]|nr:hypothetical protein [Candidatus Paceibacterota bacterium]
MTTRKFGGIPGNHAAQGQKGLQQREREIAERKRIIREKNLGVDDSVELVLEDSDPLNGAICKIVSIEPQGTLRLVSKRFPPRRKGIPPPAYDPSQVKLRKKSG